MTTQTNTDEKLDVDRKSMNLWQRLTYIKTQVRNIPKNGHNQHFNYKFVQAADVYDVVGHLMGVLGVLLVPKQIEVLGEREAKSGSILFLRFNWEMMNADAPSEREPFQSVGEGQDSGDKRGYKATTGAEKYALISFFQIPTGLDPERDDGAAQSAQGQTGDGGRRGNRRSSDVPQEPKKTQPLVARFGPYKDKPVTSLSIEQLEETISVGKANADNPEFVKHKSAILRHLEQLSEALQSTKKQLASEAPKSPDSTSVAFGPHKKKAIVSLGDDQLSETIDFAHAKLLEEPTAKWANAMREHLGVLEREVTRRCTPPQPTKEPAAQSA